MKYTNGSVVHTVLAPAGTQSPDDLALRLLDGARLTQLLEVDRFSSVHFHEDALQPLAACASCGWQRL